MSVSTKSSVNLKPYEFIGMMQNEASLSIIEIVTEKKGSRSNQYDAIIGIRIMGQQGRVYSIMASAFSGQLEIFIPAPPPEAPEPDENKS